MIRRSKNKCKGKRLTYSLYLVFSIFKIITNLTIHYFTDNGHQQASKSENTDLYSSNNFNDQLHAESITSVSEKSENCDKSYNVSV